MEHTRFNDNTISTFARWRNWPVSPYMGNRRVLKLALLLFILFFALGTVHTIFNSDSSHLPSHNNWPSWTSFPSFQNAKGSSNSSSSSVVLPSNEPELIEVYNDRSGGSRIGKVMVLPNNNPTYERAIQTHKIHNRHHGYPMHVLRRNILDSKWNGHYNKLTHVLSILLQELSKPKEDRLQWLLWFDADTIIMNPFVPLEVFLPPEDFGDIHLLVSNDMNGLNNGIFPIKVHPWSVEVISAAFTFSLYKPDVQLSFDEQSALEKVMNFRDYQENWLQVPQRWWNAFQGAGKHESSAPHQMRHGDLLVHFAGVPDRNNAMNFWLNRAEQHSPEYEMDLKYTTYPTEIAEFWTEKRTEREESRKRVAAARDEAEDLIRKTEKGLQAYSSQLKEDQVKPIREKIDSLRNTLNELKGQQHNLDDINNSVRDLKSALDPLNSIQETARKALLVAAHDAIFHAENAIVHITDPAHESEVRTIEDRITELRSLLVEHPDEEDRIRDDSKRLEEVSL
ncbi:MAG: hypothetical protein M1829_000732 [Trizodia sp. TS-e1964]|nr:MAG: hypothetical protein M1829_000732 [Trizodia sp. TS-e1964]